MSRGFEKYEKVGRGTPFIGAVRPITYSLSLTARLL